jgi:hypothetical protein
VNDREQDRKDAKLKKKQDTRKRRERGLGTTGAADWGDADGSVVLKAVDAVSRHGGALRLGYTRDGGAYAIGFYGDGEPFTEFVPPSEDINEYMKGVIDDYTN